LAIGQEFFQPRVVSYPNVLKLMTRDEARRNIAKLPELLRAPADSASKEAGGK
jgi:hypothetical protein